MRLLDWWVKFKIDWGLKSRWHTAIFIRTLSLQLFVFQVRPAGEHLSRLSHLNSNCNLHQNTPTKIFILHFRQIKQKNARSHLRPHRPGRLSDGKCLLVNFWLIFCKMPSLSLLGGLPPVWGRETLVLFPENNYLITKRKRIWNKLDSNLVLAPTFYLFYIIQNFNLLKWFRYCKFSVSNWLSKVLN